MAKIVKFKNGKYGVKRKWLFIFTHYMSLNITHNWFSTSDPEGIIDYCMGTYEEAKEALYELKQGIEEEKEL